MTCWRPWPRRIPASPLTRPTWRPATCASGSCTATASSCDQAIAALEQAKNDPGTPDRPAARPAGRRTDVGRNLGRHRKCPSTNEKTIPPPSNRSTRYERICLSLLDGIAGGPKPIRTLDLLAISYYNSATILIDMGQHEDGLKSFERSLGYRTTLMEAHPSVKIYQEQLGKNLAEIALLQYTLRKNKEALASIKKSIEILEKLVKSQPEEVGYRHDLGRSWNIQGYFHDEARENKAAIHDFERAITEEKRRAVAAAREVDLYQGELCHAGRQPGRAICRPRTGLTTRCLTTVTRSRSCRKLVDTRPTHARIRAEASRGPLQAREHPASWRRLGRRGADVP